MLDIESFKNYLKDEFPEGVIVSGGTEFVCRCRLCGDSDDSMKKHFYISLAHPTGLIMYNCFKCGNGGVLTPKKLRSLVSGCSTDLLLDLSAFNKEKLRGIPYLSTKKILPLVYDYIEDTDINGLKLKYISKRLGANLTYQDLIDNKIMLDLGSLIRRNNLEVSSFKYVMNELSDFFVGFIGLNNGTVNMRNLNPGNVSKIIDKRYLNYALYQSIDNSRRFYTIPTTCDFNAQKLRINIAEGPFDINSIFFNLRGRNRTNEIYSAIGSKAYVSVIKMYLQDFGILNPEFHIYADNDVKDFEFDRIIEILEPIGVGSYLHRNGYTGEKDYGVPLSHIKDSCSELTRELIF